MEKYVKVRLREGKKKVNGNFLVARKQGKAEKDSKRRGDEGVRTKWR